MAAGPAQGSVVTQVPSHPALDATLTSSTIPSGISRTSRTSDRGAFAPHEWWTPHRGVRLPLDVTDHVARIEAALVVAPPSAVVSGASAAILWEAPVPWRLAEGDVEITLPPGGFHVDRPGVRCCRRDLHRDHVTRLQGWPVTSPARLMLDLGMQLTVGELVAVGDDLLRRGLVTQELLQHWAHRVRRRRGILAVRDAVEHLDPRSESPRESIMRYLLRKAGYTRLQPNIDILRLDGSFVARGDLVDAEMKIVVEYDGAHHLSPETQRRDAARRLDLATEGWLEVTVVSQDLYPPYLVISKVARAYAARR
ncbi:MAG: hypothetical protein ACR2KE_02360 [Candidatus Nanopelagicales bacterium]